MLFTSAQQAAIDTRGKNLLVAAAAGSGKTKVLVERIKKMILQDNYDIDKLLVVTFTNAAAQEMRSRIHSALNESLRNEKDLETLKRLERQSVLISGASIMTIHAFCQMLLRRNFSKINLDPKFRVADEQELNLIKQEVIEELLESKYDTAGDTFKKFSDDFGGSEKGDSKLHDIILTLYSFSQSQPYPEKWLKDLTAPFDISENANIKSTVWYDLAMKHIEATILTAYDDCEDTKNLSDTYQIYLKQIEADYNLFVELKSALSARNWNRLFNLLNPQDKKSPFLKLTKQSNKVDKDMQETIKANREEYKTAVENIRNRYFFASEEELLEDIRELKPSVEILSDVTIEFSNAYAAAKRDKAIIDFNDMEHFALEILADKATAKALRKKYQAVMVDEYQDINDVQNEILSTIADPSRANFFAVGDVKQSIYKFRLADPEIFLDKYNNYPLQDDCVRIDLSKNFRSRIEVLNAVNFIFRRLMTKDAMEIDYNDEACLYYGANYETESEKMLNSPTEFYLINDSSEKDYDDENDEDEIDEDGNPQTVEAAISIEREIQVIANRIKELLANDTQVFDINTNNYRSIKYRDIVILLRAQKMNAAQVMDVLKKNQIPAYAIGDETYFKALEINVMLSLLTILDNARQDIPFAAVLLSPIGQFTAEELALLKIASRRDDLSTLLMTAAASTVEINPLNLPESILTKSLTFLKKFNSWRELSRVVSVPELISTIYRETGYYDYVGGLPKGVLRQANLRMLVDRAAAYEATAFRGLSRFLKFISKIKELNTDLSVAKTLGENENVVRIMTIHKSKGLEFPVVFIAELGKHFNRRDESIELLLKHRQLGIGPYRTLQNEPLRVPTLARQVISQKNSEEQKAEELRVLYVAMTRAREKLILVGTKKGKAEKYEKYERYGNVDKVPAFVSLSANSFLDWIILALSKETDCIQVTNIDASSIEVAPELAEDVEEVPVDMSKLERKVSTLTQKSIPSKMSVTELKERVQYDEGLTRNLIDDTADEEIIYRRPDFERSKKLTGAEYGTLMHRVMQRLDLSGDLSAKGIKQQIDFMIEQKIFTSEQASIVRKNNAAKFFASEIGQRMIHSDEIYRELPFSRLIEASRFFPNVDDKIFIQGIVDVLFKDGDNFVLIDYKTDRIDNGDITAAGRMRDKYKLQIELYGEAIEAIVKRSVTERYLYMLNGGLLVSM